MGSFKKSIGERSVSRYRHHFPPPPQNQEVILVRKSTLGPYFKRQGIKLTLQPSAQFQHLRHMQFNALKPMITWLEWQQGHTPTVLISTGSLTVSFLWPEAY